MMNYTKTTATVSSPDGDTDKVRFKGKVEQSWEWSSALPYTLV